MIIVALRKLFMEFMHEVRSAIRLPLSECRKSLKISKVLKMQKFR